MRVVKGVDHGHRPRQGPFDRLVRELAQVLCIVDEDRFLARNRRNHGRHAGVIAVTNAHRLAVLKIHAAQVFNKGGDEVLAGLFPVADDIDSRTDLLIQRQAQRILLARQQFLIL